MAITSLSKLVLLMSITRMLSSFRGARAHEQGIKTKLVVEFSRHGARAPSNIEYASLLAKDGVAPFDQPRELTEEGMRQHFEMGRQMVRQFYSDDALAPFMPNTFKQESVYVQSTDTERSF